MTPADVDSAIRLSLCDCHILVVDDTDFNRTLIGTLLEEAGYRDIDYARDGFEALEKISRRTPDLLILDIMMPGMDGFEVCRRLRADHAYADLPVLVQTALSGSDDRNRAFAAGTTDLISKPLDRAELLARVRIHLENRVLIRSLQLYRARVEGEMAMARSMYEHLLPSAVLRDGLERESGVAVRSHTLLSSDMGGDLWGVLRLPGGGAGGRFGVFLLDMAGRGVSAALNAFRMHTLIHELADLGGDPAAFLSELNDRAVRLLELGEHAAVVYGVVDPAQGCFRYAGAAGTAPMLLPRDGVPLFGDASGLPVGIAAGVRYEARELPFAPGSTLMLYSNAVLDALDAPCGPSCLAPVIRRARADGGPDRFAAVTGALETALGEAPEDDHTLVWLDRAGGPR